MRVDEFHQLIEWLAGFDAGEEGVQDPVAIFRRVMDHHLVDAQRLAVWWQAEDGEGGRVPHQAPGLHFVLPAPEARHAAGHARQHRHLAQFLRGLELRGDVLGDEGDRGGAAAGLALSHHHHMQRAAIIRADDALADLVVPRAVREESVEAATHRVPVIRMDQRQVTLEGRRERGGVGSQQRMEVGRDDQLACVQLQCPGGQRQQLLGMAHLGHLRFELLRAAFKFARAQHQFECCRRTQQHWYFLFLDVALAEQVGDVLDAVEDVGNVALGVEHR